MKPLVICLFLILGGFLNAAERTFQQNEDLAFIMQWEREQRIIAAADALALSSEQVATLRAVKVQVDAIKAEYEPQFAELKEALAAAAAEVRANIEATNAFSDEDRDWLKTFKEQRRTLSGERRSALADATMALKELLTDEQREVLASLAVDRIKERAQNRTQRQNAEKGERQRNRKARQGKRLARLLLSDTFLSQYP